MGSSRRHFVVRVLIAFVVVAGVLSPLSAADDVMRYVYAPPESAIDRRHEYRLEILRTALDRTRERHGAYALEPAAEVMLQERQMDELRQATGRVTLMYRSASPEMERDLIPVRIPVDRGLTGFRVLLIRDADRDRFAAAMTIDDLRRFTLGAELSWLDDDVLKADGFRVVVGDDYDGLFRMLANGRFDAFPRGVVEVVEEHAQRKADIPTLAIERTLLLHYPLPMYFWFPRTAEGERLAARARDGMVAMIEDGTFERIFFTHFGPRLVDLDIGHRRVFRVKNPVLDAAAPLEDHRLWFDPTRDTVPPTYSRPANESPHPHHTR